MDLDLQDMADMDLDGDNVIKDSLPWFGVQEY